MDIIYRNRYKCFDNGKIFDLKRNCWTTQTLNRKYLEVFIYGIGSVPVHRVIWEAFNGPIPKGYDIHHISKNTLQNELSNLECKQSHKHLSEHKKGKAPNIEWTEQRTAKRLQTRRQKKAIDPSYGTYEHSGEKNGMYGKHHSQQTRKAISERTKGENNPNYGKKWTKEALQRRSAKRKENQLKDPDYERKHKEAIAKMVQTRRLKRLQQQ